MLTDDEIKDIYSYTEAEQEANPYLRKYMARIGPMLNEIVESDEMRARFVLAGLFLTYKAGRYAGFTLTTDKSAPTLLGMHKQRVEHAEEILGYGIKSSLHYWKLIGYLPRFLVPPLWRRLASFVLNG